MYTCRRITARQYDFIDRSSTQRDGWAPLSISGMSTFRWNSVSATHWTWSLLGCSTVWCRGRIVDMRRRWPFGAILAVLAGFGEYRHSRVGGRGRGPTADGSWRSSRRQVRLFGASRGDISLFRHEWLHSFSPNVNNSVICALALIIVEIKSQLKLEFACMFSYSSTPGYSVLQSLWDWVWFIRWSIQTPASSSVKPHSQSWELLYHSLSGVSLVFPWHCIC